MGSYNFVVFENFTCAYIINTKLQEKSCYYLYKQHENIL